MRAAGWLLLLLGTPVFGAETQAALEAAGAEKFYPILVFEMQLEPSTTNAWSISKNAFEAVRRTQAQAALSASDKSAVALLAAAYDDRLSPSLRKLRHVVSFTRTDLQLLGFAVPSIDINARKGRVTLLRDPDDPKIDYKGPPQPVKFEAMDQLRAESLEQAELARKSFKDGLLELRSAKVDGLAPPVRDAYLAMLAAFEASIAVAVKYEEFNAPQGLLAQEISVCREYFEAANKALKPVPAARGKVVLAHNKAAAVWAKHQFELGRNSAQARYLHGELDKLGPLKRP